LFLYPSVQIQGFKAIVAFMSATMRCCQQSNHFIAI